MKTNLEIIQEFYETFNPDIIDPEVDWKLTDGFLVYGLGRLVKRLGEAELSTCLAICSKF